MNKLTMFAVALFTLTTSLALADMQEIVNSDISGQSSRSIRCRMVEKHLDHIRSIDVPQLFISLPMDTSNSDDALTTLKSGRCEDFEQAMRMTPVAIQGRKVITRQRHLDAEKGQCQHYYSDQVSVEVTNIPQLKGLIFKGYSRFTVAPLPTSECP